MKKILASLLLVLVTMALASCDSKDCRCYELSGSHWTGPHTTMTSAGTRCADLNSRTLKCNEMDEPIINPDDIGVDNKKK